MRCGHPPVHLIRQSAAGTSCTVVHRRRGRRDSLRCQRLLSSLPVTANLSRCGCGIPGCSSSSQTKFARSTPPSLDCLASRSLSSISPLDLYCFRAHGIHFRDGLCHRCFCRTCEANDRVYLVLCCGSASRSRLIARCRVCSGGRYLRSSRPSPCFPPLQS